MIRIALCDDENIFLGKYVEIINRIKQSYNYNIKISVFNSGEGLIRDIIMNEASFELVFLDILMGESNGINTAKRIREIDENIDIVFLTSSKEYALEGYEIKAFNYIIKNCDKMEDKIYEAINHSYSKTNNYIIITNKSSIEKIKISKIIYIEANKRKIIIRTTKNTYETYEKLDNVYENIKRFGFIKCHRSYIINMNYIKKIETKDIITVNGDIVPISRGNLETIKNAFIEYLKNNN